MDELNKTQVNEEDASLSKDYDLGSLLVFVMPSIFTFVFISIYQIVDGFFIEKFLGPYAISAVNLYYPIISLLLAFGLMMGTGGNAMIVKLIGEGRKEEADRIFSQTMFFALAFSILFAVLGIVFGEPIMRLLGASDVTIEYLRYYYYVLTACAPFITLQTILGVLIIGEGKTVTTGVLIIVGGVLNIVLDYVFMGPLNWGIKGAAIATVLGYIVPVLYALYFYAPKGPSKYRLHFTRFEPRKLLSLAFNGSSEMISNLAAGVTALFLNRRAYDLCGDVGVSVVSVYLYVQFVIMAVFMGFSTAVEPLFSYHYGQKNSRMGKKIFKLSALVIAIFSVLITVCIFFFGDAIAGIFFDPDGEAALFYELACVSIRLCIPACLFTGVNIFASGMFTAYSNGFISGLLSCIRTFAILTVCIFAMSAIWGSDGLWLSWGAAEVLSLIPSFICIAKYRKVYHYLG